MPELPGSRRGGACVLTAVPAAAVLFFGSVAIGLCLRQRNPRVPFIAVLGLVILTAVATCGIFIAFNES